MSDKVAPLKVADNLSTFPDLFAFIEVLPVLIE
jgi:hypothetical protein